MIFSLKNVKAKLQILASPIGNLEEISNRFLKALMDCDNLLSKI